MAKTEDPSDCGTSHQCTALGARRPAKSEGARRAEKAGTGTGTFTGTKSGKPFRPLPHRFGVRARKRTRARARLFCAPRALRFPTLSNF